MGGIQYCTRESVKAPLEEQETARSNDVIDDAIAQGAIGVQGLCNMPRPQTFAPTLATRYFDYPSRTGRLPAWRIRTDGLPLISLNSLTVDSGARTLTAAEYFLEPANYGPPYSSIEIDLGGAGAFSSASTWQRAIAATGLWGWSNDRKSIGSLSGTLAGTTTATASLAWTTARFGVGDLLFVDSEAVIIQERTFVDSTQNIGADLASSATATSVSVTDGTGFAIEEIISVGTERMRIVDIVGNTLAVRRAWDGSQLAAHTSGADIYALTGVELDRAQAGTTIAAHAANAVVYRWEVPAPLAALNRAYALNTLLQERSGYARVAGTGESAREFTGRGIKALEDDVLQFYGRQVRHRAIV